MKKCFIIAAAMLVLLCGCGKKGNENSSAGGDGNNVVSETADDGASEGDTGFVTVTDEAVIAEGRQVVSSMLDGFKALDYEDALVWVRESDREMFMNSAHSSESSETLLSVLLPRISYEFGDSYVDDEGVNYVNVNITTLSMQDIYGQVFIRMNDAMMNGELVPGDQTTEFNNAAIVDVAENGDVSEVTTGTAVRLEKDGDGNLRAVLDQSLLNAMLGDYYGAAQQMEETIGGSVDEYNEAKEAGAFGE